MDWIKEAKGILKNNQHLPGNPVQPLILHLLPAIGKENLVTLESPRVLLGIKVNLQRHFQVSNYTSPDNQRPHPMQGQPGRFKQDTALFLPPTSWFIRKSKGHPRNCWLGQMRSTIFYNLGSPNFPSQGHRVLIGFSSSQRTKWQELTSLFPPSPLTPQDVHPWGCSVPLHLSKC